MMNAENIGSSFDDFIQEERLLDEANAVVIKRVIVWQIDQEMKAQNLTKSAMAKKMRTNLTLTTLSRAATELGKKYRIEL